MNPVTLERDGGQAGRARRPDWTAAVQLVLCALLAALPFRQATPAGALIATSFGLILVVLAFADLRDRVIPNRIVLPAIVLAFVVGIAAQDEWSRLTGAATAFLVMLGIAVLARGGLGGGDVKLAALAGAVTGWPAVLSAGTIMAVAGGCVGLALLVSGRARRADTLTYGPFIALGALVAMLR